jgi:uncharacterized protein YbjT (DUF2867 family)
MRVLVTGSTGYVGSRLVPVLLDAGHEVCAATRGSDLDAFGWGAQVTRTPLDIEDPDSVREATRGVDAVVYLVHSMDDGDFVRKDREAAERMAGAAAENGVGRMVYLSGLIPPGNLSDHLRSRLEVEEVFLGSSVPTVSLRAAMVIGSGSTSFELMRRMTERVPFTPIPTWMRSTVQPIAVEDVVTIIAAALEGEPRDRAYDVGAPERPTYPELLALFADVAGLWRLQVPVPFLPVALVGRAVAVISGLPRGTVTALVESLSHDMVCREDDVLGDLLGGQHGFVTLRAALERSLAPEDDATDPRGDLQSGDANDPEWAGGAVTVESGRPRLRPRTLLANLLLGVAQSRAERVPRG